MLTYNNDVGLLLSHSVRASMKPDVYDVRVAFNMQGIASCSCSCKAGSAGKGKVLCVHIFPVVLQYTTLLSDDLAKHVLYEMSNLWYDITVNNFPKTDPRCLLDSLQSSITELRWLVC
jgi:hypothetical protein